jgi:hypothetical protein
MLTSKVKEEIRELAEDMVSVKDCKTFLMQSDGAEFKKLGEVLILDLSVFSEGGNAKGAVRAWLADCIEEAIARSGVIEESFDRGFREGMIRAAVALKDYEANRRKRLTLAKETRDELKSKLALAEEEVLERKAECDGLAEAMDMLCNESDELDRERIK